MYSVNEKSFSKSLIDCVRFAERLFLCYTSHFFGKLMNKYYTKYVSFPLQNVDFRSF